MVIKDSGTQEEGEGAHSSIRQDEGLEIGHTTVNLLNKLDWTFGNS